ncbi:hypothetical protein J6590_095131 [Homalodisca vitripennis]|nr:hypothetical protein J6590_095131 [Homalodisca vitripennis]
MRKHKKPNPHPESFLQHLRSRQSLLSLPQSSVYVIIKGLYLKFPIGPRRLNSLAVVSETWETLGLITQGAVETCYIDLQVAALQVYATSPGRKWCEFRGT